MPKCRDDQEINPETGRCRKKCEPTFTRSPDGKCRKDKNSPQRKKSLRSSKKMKVDRDDGKDKQIQLKSYRKGRKLSYARGDNCVTQSATPLNPHQQRVVEFLMNDATRGLLVVHGVGTGKTLTAVTAAECFLKKDPKHRVIVVTPTSLQKNFIESLQNVYGAPLTDRYSLYTIQGFSVAVRNKKQIPYQHTLLILDEAHNIRSEIGVFSGDDKEEKVGVHAQHLIDCAKASKKVLLLTATPIVNRPSELVNLFAMIDGVDPGKGRYIKTLTEKQLDEYAGCKVSFYDRDKKGDKDYPSSKNYDIFQVMTSSYEKKYKHLEEHADNGERAFYNAIRRGSNKMEMTQSKKIEWIVDHIKARRSKQATADDKYVMFSHFIEAGLELLKKRLVEMNEPFVSVTGNLTIKERDHAVKEYNSGRSKILLISKAGGEGLDLKNTQHIIIIEPAWNEATHMQVIGRAIRKGSHSDMPESKRHVDVYRLFLIKSSERDHFQEFAKKLTLKRDDSSEKISIDLYLRNHAYKKQEDIDEFLDKLKKVSIESKNCYL